MDDFLDVYLPDNIAGFPWTSSPRFSTTITAAFNGREQRNRNWKHPLHYFKAPEGVRCHEDIESLREHWLICGGPFYTFPIRDPFDFASARLKSPNVEPVINFTDQVLGIGDGATREFQLVKKYTRGGFTYTRPIFLPIVDTVLVGLNALDPADGSLAGGPYAWDVDRGTGIVTFDRPVHAGLIVTAGFLFDTPARFEADDSFDTVVQAYKVDGFADLNLVEVRPCVTDNDTGVTSS